MKVYKFKIYGHKYETRIIRRDDTEIVISVNGQEYKAYLEPEKRKTVAKPTPRVERPIAVPEAGKSITRKPEETAAGNAIKAPLPGLVVKVLVKPGDEVKLGDTVVIMEAMKMQNNIATPVDGTVSKVNVRDGESVLEAQDLVVIQRK